MGFNSAFKGLTGTRRAVYVQRNTEARSNNHCSRGEAKRVVYSECGSVVFVIQDAKRVRRIMSSVACVAVPCFLPHHLINGTIFRKMLLNTNHSLTLITFKDSFRTAQ
jgi:hypothetical protein